MEYLAIAYGLIAAILIGYAVSLFRRTRAALQERQLLETKDD